MDAMDVMIARDKEFVRNDGRKDPRGPRGRGARGGGPRKRRGGSAAEPFLRRDHGSESDRGELDFGRARRAREGDADLTGIVMTAFGTVEEAVRA